MTAQPCRCEELEAVVEVMSNALRNIIEDHNAGEDRDSPCIKRWAEPALASPALSSLLARREAEKAVVKAAQELKEGDGRETFPRSKLWDRLAALDAQLEKEKA